MYNDVLYLHMEKDPVVTGMCEVPIILSTSKQYNFIQEEQDINHKFRLP